MIIGNRTFDNNETYIMGILNVTPDSFSDGYRYNNIDNALAHAEKMILEGADIIDVGGESTRPGHIQISVEEEIQRTYNIIKEIKKEFNTVVSIDTYKSEVAKAAFEAGADMVNDIWGLKYDNKMATCIKKYDGSICIMHNNSEKIYSPSEQSLIEIVKDLEGSLLIAKDNEIDNNRIMVDPGIGFAKTFEMNLYIMKHVDRIVQLGYPVMMAASKKSVIGNVLDLPVDCRGEGTIATTVMAVIKGCRFVRVHDVEANKRAIKMTQAILNS